MHEGDLAGTSHVAEEFLNEGYSDEVFCCEKQPALRPAGLLDGFDDLSGNESLARIPLVSLVETFEEELVIFSVLVEGDVAVEEGKEVLMETLVETEFLGRESDFLASEKEIEFEWIFVRLRKDVALTIPLLASLQENFLFEQLVRDIGEGFAEVEERDILSILELSLDEKPQQSTLKLRGLNTIGLWDLHLGLLKGGCRKQVDFPDEELLLPLDVSPEQKEVGELRLLSD